MRAVLHERHHRKTKGRPDQPPRVLPCRCRQRLRSAADRREHLPLGASCVPCCRMDFSMGGDRGSWHPLYPAPRRQQSDLGRAQPWWRDALLRCAHCPDRSGQPPKGQEARQSRQGGHCRQCTHGRSPRQDGGSEPGTGARLRPDGELWSICAPIPRAFLVRSRRGRAGKAYGTAGARFPRCGRSTRRASGLGRLVAGCRQRRARAHRRRARRQGDWRDHHAGQPRHARVLQRCRRHGKDDQARLAPYGRLGRAVPGWRSSHRRPVQGHYHLGRREHLVAHGRAGAGGPRRCSRSLCRGEASRTVGRGRSRICRPQRGTQGQHRQRGPQGPLQIEDEQVCRAGVHRHCRRAAKDVDRQSSKERPASEIGKALTGHWQKHQQPTKCLNADDDYRSFPYSSSSLSTPYSKKSFLGRSPHSITPCALLDVELSLLSWFLFAAFELGSIEDDDDDETLA